ncbi:hypothetical protein M514_10443 [Trichuris suis]|uniref:Uncharacterized protein n=1 Tax=Trichuris suis TaxID=68888 RepID=A0A085MQ50_9BILA|nr:hypothetical protein M513_10443 [Trichuris suis]KFD59346.1 hypothetical protein M514_10443 [Trichuris suis]
MTDQKDQPLTMTVVVLLTVYFAIENETEREEPEKARPNCVSGRGGHLAASDAERVDSDENRSPLCPFDGRATGGCIFDASRPSNYKATSGCRTNEHAGRWPLADFWARFTKNQ